MVGGELSALLQLGAVGAILAFILIRLEPRVRSVERAIDRFSRVLLLDMLSRPSVSLSVTREAQAMLDEMDRERRARDGG